MTNTSSLNSYDFREQFEVFKGSILAKSGKRFESFTTGLPYEWEQYKEVVYHEARQRLNHESWTDFDVGSGEILKALINAIEIRFPKRKNRKHKIENNLVNWDARFGPESRSHVSLFTAVEDPVIRKSYESLLFDFFKDKLAPQKAFDELIQHAGKRYDFIAYVFFLKDWSQFLPIAPTNFDRAFEMLKVKLRTARRCSWENYQKYLEVVREIRQELRDIGVDDARLIDAHSFCWMLQHPNLPKLTSPRIIPSPTALAISPSLGVGVTVSSADAATRNIDWLELRDRQAALGRLAEDLVLKAEKTRLQQAGRPDLAELVESVSHDHSKGYDIDSFDEDGTARCIEVKAARRTNDLISFFLSENEYQKSQTLINYFFYLVFDARDSSTSIRYFPGNTLTLEALTPVVHTASLVEL
jgi:hypothetical protein